MLGKDTTLALLLAREAVRTHDGPDARSALLEALVQSRERRVFAGHAAPVTRVAFSLDGQAVATASEDGTVRLWDREANPLAVLRCGKPARGVRFLDKERVLVEVAGAVQIWRRDATRIASLPARRHLLVGVMIVTVPEKGRAAFFDRDGKKLQEVAAQELAVSPAGTRICTGDGTGALQLWDGVGELVATLPHDRPPTFMLFDDLGRLLVTGGGDEVLHVWSPRGERIARLPAGGIVERAAISPTGDRLLTHTREDQLVVWDLQRFHAVVEATRPVDFLAFSPDGERFYTGVRDSVTVWQRNRPQLGERALRGTPREFQFGKEGVLVRYEGGGVEWRDPDLRTGRLWPTATFARLGPRGRRVVAGLRDGGALLVDGRREIPLRARQGQVVDAAFSPDGKFLLTASRDGTARLWEVAPPETAVLDAGDPLWSCGMPWRDDTIYTLAKSRATIWRRDGRLVADLQQPAAIAWYAYDRGSSTLAVVPYDRSWARLFDTRGNVVATLEHGRTVRGVWMTRKGAWILTWGDDRTVRLWDGDGKLQATIPHDHPIRYAKPSPDGEHFFSCTTEGAFIRRRDGTVRAHWDPPEQIDRIRWSADGARFLTLSANPAIARLLDLDGRELGELSGAHTASLERVRFSREGDLILTCGSDGRAVIWNATGRFLGSMNHDEPVTYATFLPGDQRIVTTSTDGIARVWTRRGRLVAELRGHTGPVRLASYDETGDWLVTCSDDGTARVWPIGRKVALALADRRLGREFTPGERQRYKALLK